MARKQGKPKIRGNIAEGFLPSRLPKCAKETFLNLLKFLWHAKPWIKTENV